MSRVCEPLKPNSFSVGLLTRGLNWRHEDMHRLVKEFDEIIGPFIEAQKSAPASS